MEYNKNNTIKQQIKQFIAPICEIQDHFEQKYIFICTDKRCLNDNNFLQPMCPLCIEDNTHKQKNHQHKSIVRFLLKSMGELNIVNEEQSYLYDEQQNSQINELNNSLCNLKKCLLIKKESIEQIIYEIDKKIKLNLNNESKQYFNLEKLLTSILQCTDDNQTFTKLCEQLPKFYQCTSQQSQSIPQSYQYQQQQSQLTEHSNQTNSRDQSTQLQKNQQTKGEIYEGLTLVINNNNKPMIDQIDLICKRTENQLNSLISNIKANALEILETKNNSYQFSEIQIKPLYNTLHSNPALHFTRETNTVSQPIAGTVMSLFNYEECIKNKIDQGIVKFGIKVLSKSQFKDAFGIIDLNQAKRIYFKYYKNFPLQGHGIYAINYRKSALISSSDPHLHKKIIHGFNTDDGYEIYCEWDQNKDTLTFTNNQNIDQYTLSYYQNQQVPIQYVPCIILSQNSKVQLLGPDDLY